MQRDNVQKSWLWNFHPRYVFFQKNIESFFNYNDPTTRAVIGKPVHHQIRNEDPPPPLPEEQGGQPMAYSHLKKRFECIVAKNLNKLIFIQQDLFFQKCSAW